MGTLRYFQNIFLPHERGVSRVGHQCISPCSNLDILCWLHMHMVPVSDICLPRMEEKKRAIIGYMGFAPRATLCRMEITI